MSLPFYIRNMWQGSPVVLALLLAGILAVPAPAGAARPDRCKVSGAETLLVTRDARIYKTRRTRPSGAWTETVSACLKLDGARFRLSIRESDGVNESGSRALHLRRVGRRLAFVLQGDRTARVRIVGLREGTLLRDYRLTFPVVVTDFEAQPGVMAWIQKEDPSDGGGTVHMYTAHSETLLDWVEASIDEGSLRASNGSFFWTDGGGPRSARVRRGRGAGARCRPPGWTAVLTAKDVRVFKITQIKPPLEGYDSRRVTSVYHCVRRTGKRLLLSRYVVSGVNSLEGTAVEFVRRAGPTFAYVLKPIFDGRYVYSAPIPGPSVRIADLQTGRVVTEHQLPNRTWITGFEAREGALAWIQGRFLDPYEWAVHVLSGDTDKVLDSGESMDARSLSSDGTSIFWMNGGERRSAPFG